MLTGGSAILSSRATVIGRDPTLRGTPPDCAGGNAHEEEFPRLEVHARFSLACVPRPDPGSQRRPSGSSDFTWRKLAFRRVHSPSSQETSEVRGSWLLLRKDEFSLFCFDPRLQFREIALSSMRQARDMRHRKSCSTNARHPLHRNVTHNMRPCGHGAGGSHAESHTGSAHTTTPPLPLWILQVSDNLDQIAIVARLPRCGYRTLIRRPTGVFASQC